MTNVARWCEQELPAAMEKCAILSVMCKNRQFWECKPLSIGEPDKGSLVGHKEPFDSEKAAIALKTKGMYETSMNINWLRLSPSGETGRHIMGDVPTLAEVHKGAASWYNHNDDSN